jgi:hypothetical protein
MRKFFGVFFLIGLLHAGSAFACDILNKQKIQVGVSEGVAGQCSNNGKPIQCLSKGADRLTCNGPEGGFNGSNLQQLIATACGCTAKRDHGATEQLRQELGG